MSKKSLSAGVVILLSAGAALLMVSPLAGQYAGLPISPDGASYTQKPAGLSRAVQPIDAVGVVQPPAIDLEAVRAEDAAREEAGEAPRYAIPHLVLLTPSNSGAWEQLDDGSLLWRLRITSPGALSINLGFTRFYLPTGAQLFLYAVDGSHVIRPLTEGDNNEDREFWTPVVLSDDMVAELTIPEAAVEQLELEIGSINHGYRFFGEPGKDDGQPRSGACNVDAICPQGDLWRAEIPSVAVISNGGSLFCTGFMVNNTAADQAPYFMTANHCGVSAGSLVVYWNFQSPTCGQHGGGSLSQWQSGSTFKASYSTSDFTLVRLNANPNPAWAITFAGWDRSTNNPTSAVAIHHPSTDEKSISFENQACTTTSYLGTSSPGDGTHVRVIDWDTGTTEPGSSGSPLFDQNHHVVGQLHGGYAACGNNDSDWYGRFSRSWTGGGTNSTRLSNWLDPGSTGATSVDTLAPGFESIPPTPDPMTFSTAPAAAGITSISMQASLATDADSPPVWYEFDFVSGGAGGTDISSQSSRNYTDTGLSANTSYTYRVRARDSAGSPNYTGYSGNFSAVTFANTPSAPTLVSPTNYTMLLGVNPNGNPASTEFAVRCSSSNPNDPAWSGQYLDATGNPSATAVWQTDAVWSLATVQNLQPCTSYTFTVKARNSNNIETAFGPGASLSTTGQLGDMDDDGDVDGGDIAAFVNCYLNGGSGCGCANLSISAFVNCLLDAGVCP